MMARLILYMYLVYNNICYCGMEKGGKERGSRCFFGVVMYIFIVYIGIYIHIYISKEKRTNC